MNPHPVQRALKRLADARADLVDQLVEIGDGHSSQHYWCSSAIAATDVVAYHARRCADALPIHEHLRYAELEESQP